MKRKGLLGVVVVTVLLISCSQQIASRTSQPQPTEAVSNRSYWPTEGWLTAPPKEQGMDPSKLEQMMAFIDEYDAAIDSVVVVRHGYIVFEKYRNGYKQHTKHHIQSVTKSFTSMLIGVALHEGFIENVSQRLVDFFPDRNIANMDSRKQRITLEDLLTMSEGLDWHELDYPYRDKRNTLGQMWVSGDAVQYVLDRPMAQDPGEAWAYNSGTSILLGGIIEEATNTDVLSFAREYLFDPIGIGRVVWNKTTGNHYHTDGGLHMTPRDMARLGYLMLNNGTWENKEIVSPEWVTRSSSAHYQTPGFYGYGYQWWTWPGMGVYAATGHYEQKIYVVPKHDLVVVFTADIADEEPHPTDGLLYRFILPACNEYVPLRERYAKHGFSFDHPVGMIARERDPVPGSTSEVSGNFQMATPFYPSEFVGVMWETAEASYEAEASLNGFSARLQEWAQGEDLFWRSIGEEHVVNWEKGDHEMVYQGFSIEEQGLRSTGVIGSWYCDQANRVYIFYCGVVPEIATQEDLQKEFQQYLDSFVCH